ncbi:hypothetical protein BH10PAT1_BH10PAT1_3370 [soil metagenome]
MLFTYWLALLPFIFFGNTFEGAKVIYFFIGSIFLIFFWILNYKMLINSLNFPDFLFFIFLIILLISSLIGIHPILSIIGTSYRHQGVIFFFCLWIIGKTFSLLDKAHKLKIVKLFKYALIAESILIILFPIGTFGEVNASAGFIGIVSIFTNSIPILGIVFIAILRTGSRTGILVFVTVLIIKFYKKYKLVSFGLIAASIVYFLISLTLKSSSVFEDRITIWNFGIQAIKERPILGFGAESGESIYNNIFAKNNLPLFNLVIDRAHNVFLDILQWSGILGLTAFLAWILSKRNILLIPWFVFAFFQPLGVTHWMLLMILIYFPKETLTGNNFHLDLRKLRSTFHSYHKEL